MENHDDNRPETTPIPHDSTQVSDETNTSGSFRWDAPEAKRELPTPKTYYAANSPLKQFYSPYSVMMFVVGAVLGYLVRGLFIPSIEPLAPEPVSLAPSPAAEPAPTPIPIDNSSSVATPVTPPASVAPVAVPAPAAKKPSVVAKKQLRSVKINATSSYVRTDVIIDGNFKFKAKMLRQPFRIVVDLEGLTSSKAKAKIDGSKTSKPLTDIRVSQPDKNTMRLLFNISGKTTPKYTISRTDDGIKVVLTK